MTGTASVRVAIAVAVVIGLAGVARAQDGPSAADRQKAAVLYDEGQRHYNLAEYDQAIDKFRQSYYLSNEPLLLFNIGQALRLKGDCDQALHSYRAYLRERSSPENRKQVDEAIAICEEKVDQEARRVAAEQAADGQGEGGGEVRRGGGADAGGDDGAEDDGTTDIEDSADAPRRRRVFTSRAAVGPALASIGEVDTGLLVSGAFGLGVPIDLGRASLDAGALVTYTPVPWDSETGDASGTAGLTGLLVNVGLGVPLGGGRVSARLDAGAGVLVLSGITRDSNPFLNPDERATGSLRMLHARLAAGLEVAVSDTVALLAQPVVSYSPAKDLRDDISSIVQVELLLGAALRL